MAPEPEDWGAVLEYDDGKKGLGASELLFFLLFLSRFGGLAPLLTRTSPLG